MKLITTTVFAVMLSTSAQASEQKTVHYTCLGPATTYSTGNSPIRINQFQTEFTIVENEHGTHGSISVLQKQILATTNDELNKLYQQKSNIINTSQRFNANVKSTKDAFMYNDHAIKFNKRTGAIETKHSQTFKSKTDRDFFGVTYSGTCR